MSSSNSTVSLTLQIHGQQATQQIQRLNLNINQAQQQQRQFRSDITYQQQINSSVQQMVDTDNNKYELVKVWYKQIVCLPK
jgi:hypothetical protein